MVEEFRESLKKGLQKIREREEMYHASLEKGLQEIKTSQMKMECNLKKEMQELPERLKMDINERERKLQKRIDQVQGDVEKMEGKLTKKIEDDVEETKAELGERITEVTQMQKQCNNAVKEIGDRQNQLAVNLRNAIAVQREEDDQRVAMKGEAFTWGTRKKEGTTSFDQFEGEFLRKYWSKSHQCAAIKDLLHRKPLNTWRGTLRESAEYLWELNETLEQPLSDDIKISAIKRRLSRRMQETVSGSLIKDREALMETLEYLESVRSQEHKQPHICNRYCGGSHTVTTAQQRVSRVGHFLEQWGPEAIQLLEGGVKGTDGRMYKARGKVGSPLASPRMVSVTTSPMKFPEEGLQLPVGDAAAAAHASLEEIVLQAVTLEAEAEAAAEAEAKVVAAAPAQEVPEAAPEMGADTSGTQMAQEMVHELIRGGYPSVVMEEEESAAGAAPTEESAPSEEVAPSEGEAAEPEAAEEPPAGGEPPAGEESSPAEEPAPAEPEGEAAPAEES
ncbi:tropomyosin-1, isoforms 33/34-like [Schistocerca nitens]|uniref:tropomyosin-1, isoforms 33/34-like n=1 Tax=Schistocerca nitens TaxID=7011 RepID=UPI002117FBA2|nr:tropomyosin-1, isoforms 33/34-like [Schistocerca nitens]